MLERVDDRNHGAGGDVETFRQGLLRLPLLTGDGAEESEMPGFQADGCDQLAEASRALEAELRQGVADTSFPGRGPVRLEIHKTTLHPEPLSVGLFYSEPFRCEGNIAGAPRSCRHPPPPASHGGVVGGLSRRWRRCRTSLSRLSYDFSLPGQPAYETSVKILGLYGNGGSTTPSIAVVTVPSGQSVLGQRARLAAGFESIRRTMPEVRVVDYGATHDARFITNDGRSTFAYVFAPPNNSLGADRITNAAIAELAHVLPGDEVGVTGIRSSAVVPRRRDQECSSRRSSAASERWRSWRSSSRRSWPSSPCSSRPSPFP